MKIDHITFLKRLPVFERERLAHSVALGSSAVNNLISRGIKSCSLALAVAISKQSGGTVDFRHLIRNQKNVDWEYVKTFLNHHI